MDIETLREYCLSKKHVIEEFPFDDTTLVFKVCGKIFALVNLDGELSINLKCDPLLAIDLREQFSCVIPAYHMNKKHWITITFDGTISFSLVQRWIENSYNLVLQNLPKKKFNELF